MITHCVYFLLCLISFFFLGVNTRLLYAIAPKGISCDVITFDTQSAKTQVIGSFSCPGFIPGWSIMVRDDYMNCLYLITNPNQRIYTIPMTPGGAITYSSGFVNGPCALQSPGVLICINNPYPGPGTQIVFITTSTGKMVVANEFSGAPFDTWWRNSGCGVNGSFYAINPDNILFQFSLKTGQIISKVQVQSGVQTPNGMSPNNQGDFVGLWSGDLGRHYYFGTLNSRTGNTVTLNTFPNGYPGPSVFWGMPAVSDLSTGVFYTSSSNVQSGSSYITGLYSFSYNDGRMLNDSLTKFPVVLFSNQ